MAKYRIELQVWNERTKRWDLFGHNAYTNFWWRWDADDKKRTIEKFKLCLTWWRNAKSYTPLRGRIVRFTNNIPTVMMIEKEIPVTTTPEKPKRTRKVYPSRKIADGEPSIIVHAGGSHRANKEIRRIANHREGFKYLGRAQYQSKKLAYWVTPELLATAKELGFTLIRDDQSESKRILTTKWQFFENREDVPPMDNGGLGDFDLTDLPLAECLVSDAFFQMYPKFAKLGDEPIYMYNSSFIGGYKAVLSKIQLKDGKIYATSRDIRDWFNWASKYAENIDLLVW